MYIARSVYYAAKSLHYANTNFPFQRNHYSTPQLIIEFDKLKEVFLNPPNWFKQEHLLGGICHINIWRRLVKRRQHSSTYLPSSNQNHLHFSWVWTYMRAAKTGTNAVRWRNNRPMVPKTLFYCSVRCGCLLALAVKSYSL